MTRKQAKTDNPLVGTGKCSVCKHPDLDDIHLDLLGGYSATAVGMRYGLSHDAVSRHYKGHMLSLMTGAENLVVTLRDVMDIPMHMKGRREIIDQLLMFALRRLMQPRNEHGLIAHTHIDRKGNLVTVWVDPLDLVPQQFVIQLLRLQQTDEHTILKLTGQLSDDNRNHDPLNDEGLVSLRSQLEQHMYRVANGDREMLAAMQVQMAQQLLGPEQGQADNAQDGPGHGNGSGTGSWNGWGNEV